AMKALGDIDGAIARFECAVELQPALTEARLNLAQALWSRGRLADAAAAYRQVVAVDELHFDAHQQLAILLSHMGRHDEALALREAFLRRNPDILDFPLGYIVARGAEDPLHTETGRAAPLPPAWHVAEDVRYFPLRIDAAASLPALVEQFLLRDRPRTAPVL